MPEQNKVLLMILDGWGIGKGDKADAIKNAHTPFTDEISKNYPSAELLTHGSNVGLPDNQMGNSEVGHLNIGAGRVVWQMLELINRNFKSGEAKHNKTLQDLFSYCKANNKPLHLAGLLSDGGVHSSMEHLYSLIKLAKDGEVPQIFIHAFTDGRDTDPKSGIVFLSELLKEIQPIENVKLASVTGRYFAMDRDKRWERVKKAYDSLVHGNGAETNDIIHYIQSRYDAGETDEFLQPVSILNSKGEVTGRVNDEDAFLFFNFRTDRGRELTRVLSQEDFPEFNMKKLNLRFATLTRYDKTYQNIDVIFENPNTENTLGELISRAGKTQLRAAETEKYPHVTFFFSGGREEVFKGEDRIMIPSQKVSTYDLKPEMSAIELTDSVCEYINKHNPDFICLNYANPDMVGHTGVYDAIVKAVETVDSCAQKTANTAIAKGYTILITSDHGNAEYVINQDGSPNTAHTMNPVPLWVMNNKKIEKLKNGTLSDLAPTILKIMDIPKPNEMTGNELF